jgi:hypothetical protein
MEEDLTRGNDDGRISCEKYVVDVKKKQLVH